MEIRINGISLKEPKKNIMWKAKVNLIISGLILDEEIEDVIDLNRITSRSENNLDKWRSVERNEYK